MSHNSTREVESVGYICICISIYIYLSISLSVCLPVCLPTYLSIKALVVGIASYSSRGWLSTICKAMCLYLVLELEAHRTKSQSQVGWNLMRIKWSMCLFLLPLSLLRRVSLKKTEGGVRGR